MKTDISPILDELEDLIRDNVDDGRTREEMFYLIEELVTAYAIR